MLWFAAYEVIEGGARRTVPIAEFEAALGGNERAVAAPRRDHRAARRR